MKTATQVQALTLDLPATYCLDIKKSIKVPMIFLKKTPGVDLMMPT